MILIDYKIKLLIIFWEKERQIMSKHYFQKKTKKGRTQYNKVNMITEATRLDILKTYFDICQKRFTVAFFAYQNQGNLMSEGIEKLR